MAPTIWPNASPNQLRALAGVPKLTCFMSIIGSCYIIFDISRLQRRNTYHRVVFGMNVLDLLALLAWFFTTWPIPADTPGVYGAVGNQRTCDVQGFFSQLSIATVLYNACLSLYFMLVIRYGWTEKRIQDARLEYYVHFVCIGVGIGTAVASQILGLYNPAGWQCWMNSAPVGCTESWIIDHGYGTKEDPDYMPCERGDNANFYVWFFFYFPLWVCILVASGALYQVYAAYRRQDEIAEKWRQKLLKSGKSSRKVVVSGVGAITNKFNEIAAAATAATQRKKKRRRPSAQPTFTPSQRRHMRKQRSLNDVSSGSNMQSSGRHHSMRRQRSLDALSSSRQSMLHNTSEPSQTGVRGNPPYARSLSNSSSLLSYSTNGGTNSKKLPPVLGGHLYSGKGYQSRFVALQSSVDKAVDSLRRRSRDSQKRKQVNAKTQMVTTQALLYLCSFYSAWFFQSIMRIQEMTTEPGIPYFHWVFLSAIFVPLQGLMNFIVYIRPKYLQIRREKRRREAIEKQRKKQQLEAKKTSLPGSTLGTIGGGSSSALLTTSSMADSNHKPVGAFDNSGHQPATLPSIMQELDESTTHTDSDVVAVWTEADIERMKKTSVENGDENGENVDGDELDESLHVGDDAVDSLFQSLHTPRKATPNQKRPKLARSNSSNSNLLSMRSRSKELRVPEDDVKDEIEMMKQLHASVSFASDGHVLLSPQQLRLQEEAQRLESRQEQQAQQTQQQHEEGVEQAESQQASQAQGQTGRGWLSSSILRRFRKSSSIDSSASSSQQVQNYAMEKGPLDTSSLSFPAPLGSEQPGSEPQPFEGNNSFKTAADMSFQSANTSFKTAGDMSFSSLQSSVTTSFKSPVNSSHSANTARSSQSGFKTPVTSSHSVNASKAAQSGGKDAPQISDESAGSPRRRVSFAGNLQRLSIAEESSDSDDEFYNDEASGVSNPTRSSTTIPRIRRPTGKSLKHSHSMNPVVKSSRKRVVRQSKTNPDDIESMRSSVTSRASRDRVSSSDLTSRRSRLSIASVPVKLKPPRRHSPQRSSEPADPLNRGASMDDSSHSLTGSAHFVIQRISDSFSRQELMMKSKGTWMSTKRGASKLVKGTVRGTFNRVKSIRNFASDFKEALKTTDADDWATALGGSLLDSSDEEDNAADTRRRQDVEMATSSGRRRKARFYDEREEEKEEIEPIAEEHTETSRGDAEELANLWSLKSVA